MYLFLEHTMTSCTCIPGTLWRGGAVTLCRSQSHPVVCRSPHPSHEAEGACWLGYPPLPEPYDILREREGGRERERERERERDSSFESPRMHLNVELCAYFMTITSW